MIPFSISTPISSIIPIDRTLSGATTPGKSAHGSDGYEGFSLFSTDSALLNPHHLIVSCHTQDTRWVSRQFLRLPIVETLLPVTFGYSLSSAAVFMRQLTR